jgi:hypothetical protein
MLAITSQAQAAVVTRAQVLVGVAFKCIQRQRGCQCLVFGGSFSGPRYNCDKIPRIAHRMGVRLMGVRLMGVRLMGVHLMGVCLMGVHLMGVRPMGMHLTGMHLMGVSFMGMRLMDVHLTGVSHKRVPYEYAFHRRANNSMRKGGCKARSQYR